MRRYVIDFCTVYYTVQSTGRVCFIKIMAFRPPTSRDLEQSEQLRKDSAADHCLHSCSVGATLVDLATLYAPQQPTTQRAALQSVFCLKIKVVEYEVISRCRYSGSVDPGGTESRILPEWLWGRFWPGYAGSR